MCHTLSAALLQQLYAAETRDGSDSDRNVHDYDECIDAAAGFLLSEDVCFGKCSFNSFKTYARQAQQVQLGMD